MALVVAGDGRARVEHQPRLHWREQQDQKSPDMALPRPPRPRPGPARVAVVYYLSRNGQLEHPHFMEVALSSTDGLYLRDVIDRLDALRGKGMARIYSWASKRSYRNGFVWHDLTDDDYIHPVAGREYVLKGTERLHPNQFPLLDAAAAASSCSSGSQETATSSSSGWEHGSTAHQKKGVGACGAAELGEYRVYKTEERSAAAADAATQTDDSYRGRSRGHQSQRRVQAAQEELSREEMSPPTASTSPETLEALIKSDGRVVSAITGDGRTRASSVLMQLISCGSVSVKGALTTPVLPRAAHYRPRPPRPPTPAAVAAAEIPPYRQKVVEDKEYFSGSLVETKRSAADASQDFAVLRRSSSYNTDRALKAEPAKEAVDLHDRCIPRKPKSKKDGYLAISGSAHGSKRLGG